MKREIAKFFCGVSAWESFVHFTFWASGDLPINAFGFIITPAINTVQIVTPAVVSLLLGYYAWKK